MNLMLTFQIGSGFTKTCNIMIDLTGMLNYIGPGIGFGGIILVIIILLVVLASVFMVLWIPIKNFFKKLKGGSDK